jgi:uncharacterized membrane protein
MELGHLETTTCHHRTVGLLESSSVMASSSDAKIVGTMPLDVTDKDHTSDEEEGDQAHSSFLDRSHHDDIPLSSPIESHTRSLVKGLTWRIVATSTTTLIAWLITGQVDTALQIGLFEFVAKLFIYYSHERLWTRIPL